MESSNNGPQSIDDVIRMMDNLFSEIQKNISEKGLDQKIGELLASASTPDEVFKSQLVLGYMEQLSRITLQIAYLNQPIAKEGVMQQKLDGTVELDGELVSDGTRFEYYSDGAWHYGVLSQNRSTRKYEVTNWKGEVQIEWIDQLTARIRDARS